MPRLEPPNKGRPLNGLKPVLRGLETAAAAEAAVATITASATIITSTATTTATTVKPATTTAAAAALKAAAATAARAACFAGPSFIHRQRAPFNCLAVEAADRFLRSSVRRHGHKSETTRLVRELVENNLHFRDITDLAEQILQFAFRHREREIADIQFGTHSVILISCQAKISVRFPVVGSQASREASSPPVHSPLPRLCLTDASLYLSERSLANVNAPYLPSVFCRRHPSPAPAFSVSTGRFCPPFQSAYQCTLAV
jgi:hypothetical protein